MYYYLVIFEINCKDEKELIKSKNLFKLIEYAYNSKYPFQLASSHFDDQSNYNYKELVE